MDNQRGPQPFPLPLPASLLSYNELFPREPAETVRRLEQQFKKREFDPVCALLLAWFHHETGDVAKASLYAVKAKLMAPGSPFFRFTPYYLDHPEQFEARVPEAPFEGELPGFFVDRMLSLDELIERLSGGDVNRISLQEGRSGALSETEGLVTEPEAGHVFATETLAAIYESQGEREKAAQVYALLRERLPERADVFTQKIESLREETDTSP